MKQFINLYLRHKPLFLALIRGKEAQLYQPYLPFAKPILDLGCGDGFFSSVAWTNNSGLIEIGLEIDPGLVALAQRSGLYQKVLIYDGHTLPFPDASFATVTANCVLEHVVPLESCLREIYRVLRPDGRLLCTVMTQRWEDYLLGSCVLPKLYPRWLRKKQQHFHLLTHAQWQDAFVKHGFRVLKVVGYLDRTASHWLELLHYLSAPSLITYYFTKRWVLSPQKFDLIPAASWLAGLLKDDVPKEKAAALFFVLRKI